MMMHRTLQPPREGAMWIEPSAIKGHQQALKDINRMSIVRQLCVHPGLSRTGLANAVELTKSTVTLLVRELIDEGWLVEDEVVATGDLGRRPTPLFIDPERLVLVGCEVGIAGVRGVITSLTGEILARSKAAYRSATSAKACLKILAGLVIDMVGKLRPSQRVIGVGVGVPGGVEESTGFLHFAPNLRWRDVPIGEALHERFAGTALAGVPLFVQNEADVAVVGELEFNGGESIDPLLYLSINQGVGAGVIVDKRLLTGYRGFAGEVGHMVLVPGGPACSCGRRGCAEALIGARAVLPETEGDWADAQSALESGDADVRRAVEKAATYLGVLLQNLATAYDPGRIVLGGAAVQLGEAFLEPALRTLAEFSEAAGVSAPQVQVSRFGADAVALGAAALVRYRLTRSPISGWFSGIRPALTGEAA
ncbi:MAG TPA: ROK family transcriptional regulator [Burkholderiaceae bacterium]